MSPWSRFSATVNLLLHLILVGAGPVVDARLELADAASDHPPVHMEDEADPACDSGHHHQFCLIRALHSMDAPPEGVPLRIDSSLSPPRPLRSPPVAFRAATALPALGPRAPPAA